jgi:cytochrome c oxidase subunit 3/cytochrome c oxidase subunit I+III
MAIFVATEATLFGTLVGSYFYLRFSNPQWPPSGIRPPELALPLILTGVLVATSIPLQTALSWAREGRRRLAWTAIVVALFVQAGYFAMQIRLYEDDLARFTPQGSAYGSIYFTLLGAHHAHVALGMLFEAWLLWRLAGGLTRYRLVALQSVTLYWHAVNVLALAVVGTQLSPNA